MGDEDAVLLANESFYRAFAARDLAAMDNLWAETLAVACIHPGWDPLTERDAILQSWAAILGNPNAPQISCEAPRAFVMGETAFVLCSEVVAQGRLVATNVFAVEGSAWKMVHHHAGPAPAAPMEAHPVKPEVLH